MEPRVFDTEEGIVTYKDVWKKFKEAARKKGYIMKVAGDEAFRKPRDWDAYFKLISAKDHGRTILVYEAGVGRFVL